jgi:cytochrome c6
MNRFTVRIARNLILACALILVAGAVARADDSASLYKSKCSACHAADGSGSGSMGKALGAPDFRSDAVQKETDAQFNDSIANGKGKKMPAYKGRLSDDQIKGLVAYIRELGGKKK